MSAPPHSPAPRRRKVLVVYPADFSRSDARRRCAELIRLIYEVDPLVCPKCGGTMRVISLILEPKVIDKSLMHLWGTRMGHGVGRLRGGVDPACGN